MRMMDIAVLTFASIILSPYRVRRLDRKRATSIIITPHRWLHSCPRFVDPVEPALSLTRSWENASGNDS